MEDEVIGNLEDVGYSGPLLDPSKFNDAIQKGAKSTDFTALVSWLTNEIASFGKFDETVHPTSSPDDANSFLLELSMSLQELECTNKKLTTGKVNERLANTEDKLALLEYLIVELMTCKILETREKQSNKTAVITISESMTAKSLREMLTALKFSKPPDGITPETLFKKIYTKVSEIIKQVPKELIGKPLFFGELNNDQWEKLDKIQADLNEEYTIRREMLLKRLDVTINSFSWSERLRSKVNELNKCYNAKRDVLTHLPDVTLAHLLASRDDLAIIEKTSSASVRKNTQSAINSVIIGSVPDRGGRPCEQEPPPPEMPPWQKDKVPGGGRGGGGGGGRGGGRGGNRGGGGYRGGGNQVGGGNQGGGYRDNKSANSNFGQNFDNGPQLAGFGKQNFSFGTQFESTSSARFDYDANATSGYGNKAYGNQSGYNRQSSGWNGPNQSSSGYGGQSSTGYSNQDTGYGNSGGYDKRSGGEYNKGGQQNRSNRVQGGWNHGGDNNSSYSSGGYNNRNDRSGGRRY